MENLSILVEEWELYNKGILLNIYYESDTDIQDIYDYVKEVKRVNGLNSDDLELFCADWENDVLNIVTENSNIQEVFTTYNELDLDEDKIEVLNYLTECVGYEFKEALEKIKDVEVYECSSFTALAEQFVDEGLMGEIPVNIINYIDYEAIGRDLSCDYTEHNGKIYRAS